MITLVWRRAGSILTLGCLLPASVVTAFALAQASPSARPAVATDSSARDSHAPMSSKQDVCAAIAGPAQDHCKRTMRAAAAPRAASQGQEMPVQVVAPAATALLALVAVRRLGRSEPS